MFDDRLRLIRRAFSGGQLAQGIQPAIGRRIVVEQDLLSSIIRRDMQQRVQPLHRLTSCQHTSVEPLRVRFALTQVTSDFRLHRPRDVAKQAEVFRDLDRLGSFFQLARLRRTEQLARNASARSLGCLVKRLSVFARAGLSGLLAARDEVDNANHLVRRQVAQHCQAYIAVTREIRQHKVYDEHFLVIANIAVIGVPCGQPNVEPRVLADQVLVHRPDLRQLAVRSRQ